MESPIINYVHFYKQNKTLRSDNMKMIKPNPHLTQSSDLIWISREEYKIISHFEDIL